MQTNIRHVLGLVLFIVGLLLGQAVAVATFWPDLEANLFDQSLAVEEKLDTLRCPVLLTRGETGEISAEFSNALDRPISFFIRARISEGDIVAMRESQELLELEVGETAVRRWDVAPGDAVYGSLVMARVTRLRRAPLPAGDQSCGILVLPFRGISGQVVLVVAILLSLGGMVAGALLWAQGKRPLRARNRSQAITMSFITGLIILDVIVSLAGLWALGLFILVVTFLLLGAMLDRILPRR
ncbi:MAG: hypothetical protein KC425_25355 [Anaerolineales bacterium]|nr:hypothetical protein [Anaerolineales bacterium]